jgi:prepilin-type N-terminal cleavage/methylation domain-containing protein
MILRRLRSDQDGFSLIELLMAMALGSIVLAALLTVFVKGAGSAMQSSDRTEALGRGRLVMDRVVTLLSSETCPIATGGTPILDGQADQVTFYAALGQVDAAPWIYRLRYDAAGKRLWEDRFKASGTGSSITYPTYPSSPYYSQVIGTNIIRSGPSAPIFRYFQFVTTEGPTLGMVDESAPLGVPLDAAGLNAAVRIKASFVAQPNKSTLTTAELHATTLEGTATVGSANAGEPTKGVNC